MKLENIQVTSNMKIIVSQPRISYYTGGGEKIPLKHIEYLLRLNHKVTLITTKPVKEVYSSIYNNLKSKKYPNLEIIELNIPNQFQYLYAQQAGVKRDRWEIESLYFGNLSRTLIEKTKAEIVTYYYLTDSIFRPLNKPSICHLLGYPAKPDELLSSFLRINDGLISVSNQVRNKWNKIVDSNIPHFVLNSGVDFEYSKGVFIPMHTKYKLLFVGRLIPRKGIQNLLNALSIVLKKNIDVGLWIAGDGPALENLKSLAQKLGILSQLVFLGNIPNVNDYYKKADISVFPSLEKEGLMNVVLEAMSFGCPIISSLMIGNEDVIKNGENGVLIRPNNIEVLSEAMYKLLLDSKLRKKMKYNELAFANENLSWEKVALRLECIYSDILYKHKEISTLSK